MNNKVYFVYSIDYDFFDDYDRENINLTDKYFTDKNQAEMYAEYLDMKGYCETYQIAELECGDNDDYAKLIKDEEERIRIEAEETAKKNKKREFENYAILKAKIEGGDWIEIYNKLLDEYGLE